MTKKSISFSATTNIVVIHEVLNLTNFTKQEKQACWYTKNEYKSMRQKCTATAVMMESGLPEDDHNGICFRGIEQYVASVQYKRRKAISKIWEALNDEQIKQLMEGINDSEMIAAVCIECSQPSQEEAAQIGMADAAAVRSYLVDAKTKAYKYSNNKIQVLNKGKGQKQHQQQVLVAGGHVQSMLPLDGQIRYSKNRRVMPAVA